MRASLLCQEAYGADLPFAHRVCVGFGSKELESEHEAIVGASEVEDPALRQVENSCCLAGGA
ncbi:hypothetical protein GCM10009824_13530 [Kocuria atrinae]|uniref:Uncharacterized protein n=1 Tax=Kocuria atrinae TaxID=592377 RepID=A0ABP5JE52_9MICC